MPGRGGRNEYRRQLSQGDLYAFTANELAGQESDCTAISEYILATDIHYLFIYLCRANCFVIIVCDKQPVMLCELVKFLTFCYL